MKIADVTLYRELSAEIGRLVTLQYSSSFSLATKLLSGTHRQAIYSLYGYVRLADELVDSFPTEVAEPTLTAFRAETKRSFACGLSSNPVIQGLTDVVRQYAIDPDLVWAFLDSMEMDIAKRTYTPRQYQQYVYGSAEVVGLMCLAIFCGSGRSGAYTRLQPGARAFGAALQKVNFLRDIASDFHDRGGRQYFPGVTVNEMSDGDKRYIEDEISSDFLAAAVAINALPVRPRLAVAAAFTLYTVLFRKIQRIAPEDLLRRRVTVPPAQKVLLVCKVLVLQGLLRRPLGFHHHSPTHTKPA